MACAGTACSCTACTRDTLFDCRPPQRPKQIKSQPPIYRVQEIYRLDGRCRPTAYARHFSSNTAPPPPPPTGQKQANPNNRVDRIFPQCLSTHRCIYIYTQRTYVRYTPSTRHPQVKNKSTQQKTDIGCMQDKSTKGSHFYCRVEPQSGHYQH